MVSLGPGWPKCHLNRPRACSSRNSLLGDRLQTEPHLVGIVYIHVYTQTSIQCTKQWLSLALLRCTMAIRIIPGSERSVSAVTVMWMMSRSDHTGSSAIVSIRSPRQQGKSSGLCIHVYIKMKQISKIVGVVDS